MSEREKLLQYYSRKTMRNISYLLLLFTIVSNDKEEDYLNECQKVEVSAIYK